MVYLLLDLSPKRIFHVLWYMDWAVARPDEIGGGNVPLRGSGGMVNSNCIPVETSLWKTGGGCLSLDMTMMLDEFLFLWLLWLFSHLCLFRLFHCSHCYFVSFCLLCGHRAIFDFSSCENLVMNLQHCVQWILLHENTCACSDSASFSCIMIAEWISAPQ